MPDQTVTIKANVQTTGLDNAVNNSSKVHENLSASARAAQQLERFANNAGDALRRTAAAGGGVQPAATQAMAGATQARAAAYSGSRSPRETVEYGMARGAMGATGASARDFANQAQGLGGLVRLYATYAANIFAVEAAFRALNEAAKTEQMVRGLDQLGGAGGRALGALSKQLVNVTDGAISLRDAMTAVAQTSSAGMSSQNILKLGTAAQKASQVLGLNMTDAINRLSRGITKLEPELLDELGVFVRIDDAAEQYARTLGKTTSSLTEFERRTGFAVAVLKQLDEKFGTIELDTNPYDKLAASLSNLTTAGLEILNKFLKPVVDFLAQSPAALAGGIAALLSLVVKQALPVVGMYKEYLAKMREQSLAQVAQTSQAYSSAIIKNRQLAVKAAEAEAEARSSAIDKAEEKLSAIRQSKFVQEKARVMEILTKPTQLITQDDLNYLQKQSDKNAKTNADLAKSYLEVKDTIIASKKAEGDYAVASKSLAEAKLLASEQVVGSYKNELKFKELSRKATIDETVANVNRYAKETNFLSAIYKGLSEINVKAKEYTQLIPKLDQKGKPTGEFESITMTKNFSTTEKLMAGTRVVTAGLASGLEKLISTAGTLGLAIGAISGVIALLKSAFTDNAKEAKDYEQALVSLQGAAKAADETLRALSKQQSGKFLSPESILARAQAVYNLSEALDDTVAKAGLYNATLNDFGAGLNKLDQIFGEGAKRAGEAFRKNVGGLTGTLVGGGLEGFGRLFQGIFGTDKITELSNGLAEAVNKTYKLARNAQERTQIQSLAKQIYGSETDISNLDQLKKYLLGFSFEEVTSRAEQFANGIRKIAKEAMDSATALMAFKDSIKVLSKDIADLNTSLIPTDRLAKVGIDAMQSSGLMTKALTNVENTISSVHTVLNDFNTLSLFPEGFIKNIAQTRREINDTVDDLGAAKAAIEQTQLKIADPKAKDVDKKAFEEQLKVLQQREAELTQRAATLTTNLAPRISEQLFTAGASKVEASFKFAMERASIAGARAYLDVIKAAGGYTAKEELRLAKAETALQIKMIEIQYQSYIQAQKNQLATEELNNTIALNTLSNKVRDQGGVPTGDDANTLDRLVRERRVLQTQRNWLEGPVKSFKELEKIRKEGDDISQEALRRSGQYYSVIAGREAQLAEAKAKNDRDEVNAIRNKALEEATKEERRLETVTNARKIEIDRVSLSQSLLGIYDDQLATQQLNLEILQREDEYKKKIAKTTAEIDALEEIKVKRPKDFDNDKALRLQELRNSRADAYNQKEADNRTATVKFQTDRVKKLEEFNQKERNFSQQILQINNEISTTRLDASLQYLQVLEAFGAQDKIGAIQARARVDLLKEELQFNAQLSDLKNKQLDIDSKRAYIALVSKEGINTSGLTREADREQKTLDAQRDSILAGNEARKESIRLQAEQNVKLEQQNYLLEQGNRVSNILNNDIKLFGPTFSQGLAGAIETLGNVKKNIDKGKAAQEDWNRRAEEYGDFPPPAFIEEGVRLQKKAAEDELDRNAQVLGSTKKLFKEKTAAYKTFGALEKAYHIARLIMSAKEIATTIAQTVSFVTSSITRQGTAAAEAGVLGVKAVINAMSTLPPPFNFAAGAAMTAAVAALLAGIGRGFKGGGGSYSSPSTEDQAKYANTAMGYNEQGQLVQQRRGVVGEPEKRSESVANSIGILEKNSVDGLAINNRMLDALRSIDRNIKVTSVALYASSGLKSGQIPGLAQSGSFDVSNIGTTLSTAAGSIAGIVAGELVGIFTAELIGAGLGSLGGPIGMVIGAALGKAIGDLIYNEKVTTEIKQSGIKLTGSILDLAKKPEQAVKAYVQGTKTTRIGGAAGFFTELFGGDRTSTEAINEMVNLADTKLPGVDTIIQKIGVVFSNGIDVLSELALKTGKSATFVNEKLSETIQAVEIPLKDVKTGAEAAEQVSGAINAVLDEITLKFFGEFTDFAEDNEALLQTVIRVVSANEIVNQQLKNIGGSGGKDYFASEKLIDLFGGVSQFIDQTNDFRDKFLTEAQRLAPITQAVNTEFDRLNKLYGLELSTSMTREQFASTTAASEGNDVLFRSLIRVSAGFDQVLDSTEKAAEKLAENAKKASEKVDLLTEAVLDYRNATTQLEKDLRKIRKTHTETIKELEELGQATQDNINLVAEYTKFQLLERIEQDIQKLYETRRSELDKTIDTLTQAKTRILDLRDSLLRGPQSTLTPVQKNVNLRTAYGTLLGQTTSALPEERELGRSKIVDIAQQYLQSSQEIYRSSQMYTMIYNQIISDLNTIYGDIEGELQNAKTDRSLLEESVNFLGLIKTNTENTAQKLTQLLNLYSTTSTDPGLTTTVQARATGGLASGVTLVGERGPELVDFRDPGRVYSANQTRGMFGMEQTAQYNQQMLAELRSLNEKIDCLEQVVAEGAVLNANATNKNTQQIVGAVVVNTSQTVESTRLQSRIVIK